MKLSLLIIGLCLSSSALAHGPTPQKTDESIVAAVSASSVWETIIVPCGIQKWHPEVTKCEITAEKKQTLTLKNGKTILQEIDDIDTPNMTFAYRLGGDIDTEALNVSSLFGKIKVKTEAGQTKVNWTARYYRAYTGNQPPEGQDDATAKATIDAFVKAGLQGLGESSTAATQVANNPKTANSEQQIGSIGRLLKAIGLR